MTFTTLEGALDHVNGDCSEVRPYRVTIEGIERIALAKSQGQAALAVAKVELCSRKEISDAMVSLLKRRTASTSANPVAAANSQLPRSKGA